MLILYFHLFQNFLSVFRLIFKYAFLVQYSKLFLLLQIFFSCLRFFLYYQQCKFQSSWSWFYSNNGSKAVWSRVLLIFSYVYFHTISFSSWSWFYSNKGSKAVWSRVLLIFSYVYFHTTSFCNIFKCFDFFFEGLNWGPYF